jgi:predicted DCC family thiol-disulfide oxidoreductase YuxK
MVMVISASNPLSPLPALTVWYNTRCPVCDAGIDSQRNKLIALVKAGTVEFRDINIEPDALRHHGATLEDIRKRLHATTASDDLITGADVAIALWRITPGQGWLAALCGNRIGLPFSRVAYNLFADVLYRWNRRKGHW